MRKRRTGLGLLVVLCSMALLLVGVRAGQTAAVDELCHVRLMGVCQVGQVTAPQLSAEGSGTAWVEIVSDPGSRLTLADGVLQVGSLPSGYDYEEAEVTLELTEDEMATQIDIRLIIYDPLYHTLISVPNPSLEAVDGTLPADWKSTGTNSETLSVQASTDDARTGTGSVHLVDRTTDGGVGLRSNYADVTVVKGRDYVASIWARGSAQASTDSRDGASMYLEFYNTEGTRQGFVTQDGVDITTDGWTQLSVRGTANGVRATVMGYSYAATTGDMYFDDALLWEITAAGILADIDQLLLAGQDADTLYARLGNAAISVTGLEEDNKAYYLTWLAQLRTQKGAALTEQELAAGVLEANQAQAQADQTLVEEMAAQVASTQSLSALGEIAVPTLSDDTVSVAWTQVSGDSSGRIRMTEAGPVLDSQPDHGGTAETVVMTLTITKREAAAQVAVTTTIQPYTQSMSKLIQAAGELDISTYLNGQSADYITQSLDSLPSSVRLGLLDYVQVSWKALNVNTYAATGIMSNAGAVNRGPYETADTAVVLQATLTKDSDTYTKEFYLLVPSLGADDAQVLIADNAGFEAAAPSDATQPPEGWIKHTLWADGPNEVETTYAAVDDQVAYGGSQSLRITVDETLAAAVAEDSKRAAAVQNDHIFTAKEGHVYSLQAMVFTRSQTTDPSITLRFLDNEGNVLSEVTRTYQGISGMWSVWKNLSIITTAPAGTVMVAAELDGGTQVGVSWFDNVRLREMPLVPNGTFELDTVGWTTDGSVSEGALVLASGQTAQSVARPAQSPKAYFLTVEAQGSGTAALQFLDSSAAVLAEHQITLSDGTNTLYAYAPTNTKNMQVVLTGGSVSVDNVRVLQTSAGTGVADGGFEDTASGLGTPWELTDAAVTSAAGVTGAGVTVEDGGTARSAIIPVIDGKSYTFTVDVKGEQGVMSVELYNRTNAKTPDKVVSVTSGGSGWNTICYTFDQLPEVLDGSSIEHAYARVVLSGPAVFDNAGAYSVTDTLSNPSVENVNNALYGTLPYNWSVYGPAAGFMACGEGQAAQGIKSLGVELFGLGSGGVRSSMVRARAGQSYEATAQVKGSGVELGLEFWDEEHSLLTQSTQTVSAEQWQSASITAEAPAGTAYVSLSLGGEGTGLAYVDQAAVWPVVRPIGSNLQLFLDDWLIQESTNVTRTFQPGEKLDQMFTPGWYGNVVWNPDKQLYEMWYQVSSPDSYSLRHRTSQDGVTWSNEQDCTTDGHANGHSMPSPTVFLDLEETDASRRYKLICYNLGEGGYSLQTSADGISWTRYGTVLPGADVITVAYDPVNKQYIATYKMSQSGTNLKRTHSIAVSKDLINWSEGVRMYSVATPEDIAGTDYLRADGYGTSMYPLGDSCIALNWRFLLNEGDGYSGKMDVPMLFSRDLTEDWQRLCDGEGQPVLAIPRGEEGQWDDAQTYAHSYPINIGDETWWYYHGWNGDHGVVGVPKTPGISAVKWRKNGFASLDFAADGTMTTRPFVLEGQTLRLNAKGALAVELLDAEGGQLALASFDGDSVDAALAWDRDVSAYLGQPVRLRFSGSDAQLYSVQQQADVTVIQSDNGTLAVTPQSGVAGTQVTVTATPDEGYVCLGVFLDGEALAGDSFVITGAHTLTAVFRPEDELFYDEMEDYGAGAAIPVGSGNKFGSGQFADLNGGTYSRYIRQDEQGNRYLEMTAANTASSTGLARFWIQTEQSFQGDYALRYRLNVTSEQFYVTNTILGGITGPDGAEIELRVLGVDEGTCRVYFAGSAYDSSLQQEGDTAFRLYLRDSQGEIMTLDKNTWYTYEILVDSQAGLVTANIYSDQGTLLGSRILPGCTMAQSAVRFDHFSPTPYTVVEAAATALLDDVTVSRYEPVRGAITVGPTANGTVSADKTAAAQGETVSVTAAPAPGYKLDAILVNGEAIEGSSFVMPAGDVTLSARFVLQGTLFCDTMEDYQTGIGLYDQSGGLYSTTSAAWNSSSYITGSGAGSSTVAVAADPVDGTNTCLKVTAENNSSSAKRYILVTTAQVSGDYVLEFDYMPTAAATNSGSGFLDVYLAGGRADMARLAFKKDANNCYFYCGSTASSFLADPDDSDAKYPFKDNTWYSVRITVASDGYVMELWEKGKESTTKSSVSTADYGAEVTGNTSTQQVEFCFGPYNASQVTSMDAPFVNYIDNITITQLRTIQTVQPEQGGSVQVQTTAKVGQTVEVTAQPEDGYKLDVVLVDGQAVSGTSFVMPDRAVTVTAVFRPADELFYDDMERYTADTAIPVGSGNRFGTGYFTNLNGGTYSMFVRQDEQGDRYLEMISTNTASSTGLARFWIQTGQSFEENYVVRWRLKVSGELFYVTDTILPQVTAPDDSELTLRVRGNDEDTCTVYFAGKSFDSSLRQTGDDAARLYLRDTEGEVVEVDKDTWYTYELVVRGQNSTVTANLYDGEGSLLASRQLPGCDVQPSQVRFDHFSPKPYTSAAGAMACLDDVTVSEHAPFHPVIADLATANGTVRADVTRAARGDVVTVTAQPDPGYELVSILVDGQEISGTSFTMPDHEVTVSAQFELLGRLFYDDMESYTAGAAIPVGSGNNFGSGYFTGLNGGTYSMFVRQDEQGNRYLEMTAANTASSTDRARFYINTASSFSSDYIARWNTKVVSDSFYVNDGRLPTVLGPDKKVVNLRVRDYDGTIYVCFAGNGFDSSLFQTGDNTYTLFLRDEEGDQVAIERGQWYTLEMAVNSTAKTVTGYVYDAQGQLLGSRMLSDCTIESSVLQLDHFACSSKTVTDTTMAHLDNVGVHERYALSALTAENGSVRLSRTDAAVGDTVTVTATPDQGYALGAILVDGQVIQGSSFRVTGDHEVSAQFGDASVTGVITDTGRSLSLQSEVYINQYVTISGFEGIDLTAQGGLLIWESEITQDQAVYDTADTVQPGLVSIGTEYSQRTLGIPARRYADELYLRVYVQVAEDQYVYGPLTRYSVQEYCQHKLYTDGYSQQLRDTCAALLHYGAAAQQYFGYNTEDPANANILADYPAAEWDEGLLGELDAVPGSELTPTGDIADNGQSLSLTGAVRINYYFGFAGEVSRAELLIWEDVSGTLSEENATLIRTMSPVSGEYTGQGVDYAARQYAKTTFACARITDSQGQVHYSRIIAYSPQAYAEGKLSYDDPELVELVKRMVVYGESASVYFAD